MQKSDQKFKNYSNASRLRQASIPPAIRRARASAAAKAKWAALSPEARRAHAALMMRAKQFGKRAGGK